MKKRHVLVLWAILLLLFSKVAIADKTRPVTMACSSFPPYKIENPGAGPKGIDVDIMLEVFALAERTVDYKFYPWKRAVKLVEQGKIDGLCGCSYHPDRNQNFIFSDILGQLSQGVFLSDKVSLNDFKSVADLKDLSVASVRGYAVHKELIEHGINTHEATNDDELLTLLENGRVDAIYSYRDTVLFALANRGESGHVTYREFVSHPYYFCFSKKSDQAQNIINDINRGLRIIRHNGTYEKIRKNYQ
ncbi:ABC transporter substrate-binding protein [Kiloniella sp. EL199]|uniref:substrate-binding periplasmic protein n=1 Tax=Kiloniella sp. EL199 TaxID=2107581 RepID=UPI000EA16EBD|nr:transporter substrate-binding domain-containing protein [Kiloniella sp. EL199]